MDTFYSVGSAAFGDGEKPFCCYQAIVVCSASQWPSEKEKHLFPLSPSQRILSFSPCFCISFQLLNHQRVSLLLLPKYHDFILQFFHRHLQLRYSLQFKLVTLQSVLQFVQMTIVFLNKAMKYLYLFLEFEIISLQHSFQSLNLSLQVQICLIILLPSLNHLSILTLSKFLIPLIINAFFSIDNPLHTLYLLSYELILQLQKFLIFRLIVLEDIGQRFCIFIEHSKGFVDLNRI